MPQMSTLRRKGRIDDFVEVLDLDGNPQLLPPAACEIVDHHSYVALHFGSGERVVRIPHQSFNSLVATRQAVFVSW